MSHSCWSNAILTMSHNCLGPMLYFLHKQRGLLSSTSSSTSLSSPQHSIAQSIAYRLLCIVVNTLPPFLSPLSSSAHFLLLQSLLDHRWFRRLPLLSPPLLPHHVSCVVPMSQLICSRLQSEHPSLEIRFATAVRKMKSNRLH